jgi:death-on-curing protein
MTSEKEIPVWLSLQEVLAVHEKLLALFGGASGIRDRSLLDSALHRAQNVFAYENSDIFILAAAYADGIVNNHPFVDGNKRTGFVAAVLFLETNGFKFNASNEDAVTMTIGLASKSLTITEYSSWLRTNSM